MLLPHFDSIKKLQMLFVLYPPNLSPADLASFELSSCFSCYADPFDVPGNFHTYLIV